MTSTNNNPNVVETPSVTPAVVETSGHPANDTIPAPPPVHVANDNAKPRTPLPGSLYSRERVDQMLVTAGYDPTVIPVRERKDALWVAWAYKAKLFDRDDLAEACNLSAKRVRRIIEVLRDAAKPGTVVA